MTQPTPRIYADFNGYETADGGSPALVPLDTLGSLRDLSNAGVRLTPGAPLQVYDESDVDEDLEADAIARFDSRRAVWLAELSPAGFRYVPRGARSGADEFHCLRCRRDLGPDMDPDDRWPGGLVCPYCGTSLTEAVAPPPAAAGGASSASIEANP